MAKKKAAKPVVVETEDEDVELEELDAEVEDDTPAKAKKSNKPEVVFGVSDLCAHLNSLDSVEKEIKPRELRTLIRKMAREEEARINREIVPGNRTRYDWPKGLQDPEVKAIIAAVTGGELEADKQEKLQALKEQKAAKAAKKAKKKAAEGDDEKPKKKKKKVKKVEEVVEDDDEVDDIDLDDDDEDDD